MRKNVLLSYKNISLLNIVVVLALVFSHQSNSLFNLEKSLSILIETNQLPIYYFPFFIIVGLIVPIFLSLTRRKDLRFLIAINLYLYLMFSQIILEIVFTILLGKGLGVIIGLIYTLARLYQLQGLPSAAGPKNKFNVYFIILFILWSVNLIQISYNRIIPLFFQLNLQ